MIKKILRYKNAVIIKTDKSKIYCYKDKDNAITLVHHIRHSKILSDEEKSLYSLHRDFFGKTFTEQIVGYRKEVFEALVTSFCLMDNLYPSFAMMEILIRKGNDIPNDIECISFEITKNENGDTLIKTIGSEIRK
jgi:hypothetical protein